MRDLFSNPGPRLNGLCLGYIYITLRVLVISIDICFKENLFFLFLLFLADLTFKSPEKGGINVAQARLEHLWWTEALGIIGLNYEGA